MTDRGERDMSRAHWQRSEGMVLYGHLSDELYADSTSVLPDDKIQRILSSDSLYAPSTYIQLKPHETKAYQIARGLFFSTPSTSALYDSLPDDIAANIEDFTFRGTQHGTLEEAHETMAHFPLNLAFTVSRFASLSGIEGYQTDSLAAIAALLQRTDYRKMANDAALTTSGWWATSSGGVAPDLTGGTNKIYSYFTYSPDTKSMALGNYLLGSMRDRLADNNKMGISVGEDVSYLTSSGCPARHLRAHFVDTEEDQYSLLDLSEYLGKSPDDLTLPRQKTAIDVGLDYLSDAMTRAARIQQEMATTALAAV